MKLPRAIGPQLWGAAHAIVQGVGMAGLLALMSWRGGLELLGAWSACYALFSFVRLADLGTSQAVMSVARIQVDVRQRERISALVSFNLLLILVLGLPLALGLWGAGLLMLQPSMASVVDYPLFAAIISLAVLVQLFSETLYYTLTSIGRASSAAAVQLAGTLIYYCAGALLALMDRSELVPWAHLAGAALATCAGLAVLARATRGLRWRMLNKRARQVVLRIALGMWFTQIFQLIQTPLANLAISSSGNLATVGLFELVTRIFTLAREIAVRAGRFLSAELRAVRGDLRNDLLRRSSQYSALMSAAVLLGSVYALLGFTTLFPQAGTFFTVTYLAAAVGTCCIIYALPSYFLLIATGRTRTIAYSAGTTGCIALTISGFAWLFREPVWVPLGLTGGLIVGQVYLVVAALGREVLGLTLRGMSSLLFYVSLNAGILAALATLRHWSHVGERLWWGVTVAGALLFAGWSLKRLLRVWRIS